MGEAFAYKEYLAGLLAGVATVITGHPFDTVKVKLQIHNTEAHGIKYKNGLHCTARMLQTEGSLQGGLQSDAPRPQVIIPSAAYGGAYQLLIMPIRASKRCKFKELTPWFQSSVDTAALLIVPSKQ